MQNESPSIELLLDTAFCLALIKHRPAGLAAVLTTFRPGEIAISSLSVAALVARARHSQHPQQNLRALEHFLLPLRVVDFDAAAARRLAGISAARAGSSDADAVHVQMLAAQALQLNAALVTSQPARYAAVPGPVSYTHLNGAPVFGLPGNPVSAMVIFDLFVAPTIRLLLGAQAPRRSQVQARLARNLASTSGREDYVQVRLEERGSELWAVPVLGKSNLIYTLVHAEGAVKVPLDSNGVAAGEWVNVRLD